MNPTGDMSLYYQMITIFCPKWHSECMHSRSMWPYYMACVILQREISTPGVNLVYHRVTRHISVCVCLGVGVGGVGWGGVGGGVTIGGWWGGGWLYSVRIILCYCKITPLSQLKWSQYETVHLKLICYFIVWLSLPMEIHDITSDEYLQIYVIALSTDSSFRAIVTSQRKSMILFCHMTFCEYTAA